MLTGFQNSFIDILSTKFAIKCMGVHVYYAHHWLEH